jgi:hypothetical protein
VVNFFILGVHRILAPFLLPWRCINYPGQWFVQSHAKMYLSSWGCFWRIFCCGCFSAIKLTRLMITINYLPWKHNQYGHFFISTIWFCLFDDGPAPDPNSAAIYYPFYISTYLNLWKCPRGLNFEANYVLSI